VRNANPSKAVQDFRVRNRVRVRVRDLGSVLCTGSVPSSASTRGVGRIRRVVERDIKGEEYISESGEEQEKGEEEKKQE
jgi:hypothetical protein